MEESLILLFSLILLVLGIIGTILPILPGLLLSLCGLLIYKYGGDADISMIWILLFIILTALSLVLNYVIPAKTTRKYGGTRYGSVGSVVGTILGLLFIPIPFGFLIGMFAGVFFGELLHDFGDTKKAFSSLKGAFIGFILGTAFNFVVALAMLLVVLFNLFKF